MARSSRGKWSRKSHGERTRIFQVFNVVPSISAVTGISPGRYLWRVVIAFHLGPRLLIVATYYHFLLTFLETAARRQGRTTKRDFYSLPPLPSFLKTLKNA